jgi:Zn-dependent peptidase ImmA (M78 family)
MMSENPMNDLYERLEAAGLTRHYVKQRVLPDWWDDRIARNPVGMQQAYGYVSKHSGLALHRLRDETASLKPSEGTEGVRLKARDGVPRGELSWATSLSFRASEMAAHAMENSYQPVEDAAHIRESILADGQDWVGFEALLDFCWNAGIPVLQVDHFPQGAQKMAGMAVAVNEHPVIVLSKRHKHEAWLAFICAHELGHIARGHLSEGELLTDEKLDLSSGNEREEQEADDFAVALLAGDARFVSEGFTLDAERLAETALDMASEHEIAPGVMVLNYVWYLNQERDGNYFPLANAALNALYPEAADAQDTVRRKMAERFPFGNLPEESAQFLRRLTGTDEEREREAAHAS